MLDPFSIVCVAGIDFCQPFGLRDADYLVTELSCSEQENDQCCNQHCDKFE